MQCYSHIKHTVLCPYDRDILPVSFNEVNQDSGNVYDEKVIPESYNPLAEQPIQDTFDERDIKKNTIIARDLFEKYANMPLICQKEEQVALISNTEIELPLRYTYIHNVSQILLKTTKLDDNGNNIWFNVPKRTMMLLL